MKKQVHPAVVAVIVVVVLGVIGYVFYSKTASPPPMGMSPLGPAALLQKMKGNKGMPMSRGMTPDVQMMQQQMQQQQQQGGQNSAPAGGK